MKTIEKKATPTELKNRIDELQQDVAVLISNNNEISTAYNQAVGANVAANIRLKTLSEGFNVLTQRFAQVTEVAKLQGESIKKLNRLSEMRREYIVDMEAEAGARVPLPTNLFE